MILGELFGIASARAVRATEEYRALGPEEAKALYRDMLGRAMRKTPPHLLLFALIPCMCLFQLAIYVGLVGLSGLTGPPVAALVQIMFVHLPSALFVVFGALVGTRGRAWFLLRKHLTDEAGTRTHGA